MRYWLVLLFGLLPACGDDSGSDPEPVRPDTTPSSCDPGPGYREDGAPQQVDRVEARLVDLDGEPVESELVQVCGLDLCTNGKSGLDGRVSMTLGQKFLEPAFKFGEGRVSARFAQLLPDETELDLGEVRTVRLPELSTAVPLVAGGSVAYEGFELMLAGETEIGIDGLSFRTAEERGLRAVAVAIDEAPDVVAEGPGLEIVWAATPVETRFCPPAALSVPNSESWAPATAVEVYLHGVDITEEWAPYGGWAKISEAVVSDDGERIETTDPGLPVLGVLGLRRAD
ncbi:MAG: hypothetical protein M3020_15255 [Myxococcota bacterium]|nr:hypothetical protein [Myxococcota bacterium]